MMSPTCFTLILGIFHKVPDIWYLTPEKPFLDYTPLLTSTKITGMSKPSGG
jgi:hypothetical protein